MKTFKAPCRVNLLGEHTDYTGGLVLPIATSFYTHASIDAVVGSQLSEYRFTSKTFEVSRELAIGDQSEAIGNWSDYPVGILRCLQELGISVPPFHLHLGGNVPLGAGLSSSASIEVASALAMLSMTNMSLTAEELSLLCQRAENSYVYSPCGIMDQFAIVSAHRGKAMLLDTGTLAVEHISLDVGDLANAAVVVCNSMVKHSISSGDYGDRRHEVEQGQAIMLERFPTMRCLADANLEQLISVKSLLSEKSFLRCRHIVTENQRVRLAVHALRAGDPIGFGSLMLEGHSSERDDFDCSCREIDFLVETAQSLSGCYGARLTGGGFGGCTVNLIERAQSDSFIDALRKAYREEFGFEAEIYLCEAVDGALLMNVAASSPFDGGC